MGGLSPTVVDERFVGDGTGGQRPAAEFAPLCCDVVVTQGDEPSLLAGHGVLSGEAGTTSIAGRGEVWDGEAVAEAQAVAELGSREGGAIPEGGLEGEPVAGFPGSFQAATGGGVGGLVDVKEGGDFGLYTVSMDGTSYAADVLGKVECIKWSTVKEGVSNLLGACKGGLIAMVGSGGGVREPKPCLTGGEGQ